MKISVANTGNIHSDEAKKKISLATKGENNPMFGKKRPDTIIYKLNEEKVLKIRDMWATGEYETYKELGQLFNISRY